MTQHPTPQRPLAHAARPQRPRLLLARCALWLCLLPALSACGEHAIEQVHVEGFEQGFEQGRTEGSQRGYVEGHRAGYAEGLELGQLQGLEAGRAEALKQWVPIGLLLGVLLGGLGLGLAFQQPLRHQLRLRRLQAQLRSVGVQASAALPPGAQEPMRRFLDRVAALTRAAHENAVPQITEQLHPLIAQAAELYRNQAQLKEALRSVRGPAPAAPPEADNPMRQQKTAALQRTQRHLKGCETQIAALEDLLDQLRLQIVNVNAASAPQLSAQLQQQIAQAAEAMEREDLQVREELAAL